MIAAIGWGLKAALLTYAATFAFAAGVMLISMVLVAFVAIVWRLFDL